MTSGCKFTPKDVKIVHPRGYMLVHMDNWFPEATKDGCRQLFKILRQFRDYNEPLIPEIREYLDYAEDAAKEAWKQASQAYVNGYRLPENVQGQDRKKVARENDKLMRQVKTEKALYERLQDRKTLFLEFFPD